MLADVNALLKKEREKLSGISKQFSQVPHSHQKSLACHIPKDMNRRSSILLTEEKEVLWNT